MTPLATLVYLSMAASSASNLYNPSSMRVNDAEKPAMLISFPPKTTHGVYGIFDEKNTFVETGLGDAS